MAENGVAGPLRAFADQMVREYPEQHRQMQESVQQNLEQGRAANAALLDTLNAQRGGGPSPLLQFASGLLRPTRAGSFAESLGAGIEGYSGALQQQRQSDMDRAMRIQQLQAATANLGMQAAQQRMALLNQGMQFPGTVAGAYGNIADLGLFTGGAGSAPVTRTQLALPAAAAPAAAPGTAAAMPGGAPPAFTREPLAALPAASPAPTPARAAAPAPARPFNPETSPDVQAAIARATEIEARFNAEPGNQELAAAHSRALADIETAWNAASAAAAAAPAPAATAPAPAAPAAPAVPAPAPAAARPPAGPAASSDPQVASAQRLLADAAADPSRYAGPQGRQLIERARKILSESPEGQAEVAAARKRAEEVVEQETAPQRADRRFGEESATQQARTFGELASGGGEARQLMDRLQVFDQVSADLRSGVPGWFEQQAARVGFGPRATYIETATALLKQLIPAQRQGMPGAVSDFDARNFELSLPRLIGTPEGRVMISNTLKSVAEYNIARAEIASAAQNGDLTRQQAVRRLAELPSPFVRFNRMEAERQERQQPSATSPGAAPRPEAGAEAPRAPAGVDPGVWGAMTPEERALWQN
jgi:hypothetical protein